MTKVLLTIVVTIITFALTISANTTTMGDQDSSTANNVDVDVIAVMNSCNDSFRIEMGYLQALNESGSFIDETDRTPKCFIRCVFENVGILTNVGTFNPSRAAVIFAGERNGKPMDDIGEMTVLCAADRQEKCKCERSYQFLRCLMSMEIERYEKS